MCLIYYRNTDKHDAAPNWDALERAWKTNNDGTGVAWYNGKRWRSWKDVSAPWKTVRKMIAKHQNAKRLIVHFRWTTHGLTNTENCHPFTIGKGIIYAHNGTFAGVREKEGKSDTRRVSEVLKSAIDSGCSIRTAFNIAKMLGDGNRQIITTPNGGIYRAGSWTERAEGMYSNTNCLYTYCQKTTYKQTTYKNGIGFHSQQSTSKAGQVYRGTAFDTYDDGDRYFLPNNTTDEDDYEETQEQDADPWQGHELDDVAAILAQFGATSDHINWFLESGSLDELIEFCEERGATKQDIEFYLPSYDHEQQPTEEELAQIEEDDRQAQKWLMAQKAITEETKRDGLSPSSLAMIERLTREREAAAEAIGKPIDQRETNAHDTAEAEAREVVNKYDDPSTDRESGFTLID